MRSCLTAVLEKHASIDDEFATEPYEVPWADQVRFFVHTLQADGGDGWTYYTEVSPDGLHWCDSGEPPQTVDGVGLISWAVSGFGQWLRVRGVPAGGDAAAVVRIYLVGKS